MERHQADRDRDKRTEKERRSDMAGFCTTVVVTSVFVWSIVQGMPVVSRKYDMALEERALSAEENQQQENRNDYVYSYDENLRQIEIGSADPFCHIITFRDRVLELFNVAEQCLDEIVFDNCCQPRFLQLHRSGVYPIHYTKHGYGYCDMDTDGGGWTVIVRRMGGRRSFDKTWKQYQRGFGPLDRDFWIGLDTLFAITRGPTELRVDLRSENGTWYHAYYEFFGVGAEIDNYELFIAGYDAEKSSIYDAFSEHNGAPFTTKDIVNLEDENSGCLHHIQKRGSGGWWYLDSPPAEFCFTTNFCDQYYFFHPVVQEERTRGILWPSPDKQYWQDDESFVYAEMKIRPRTFECGHWPQDWDVIQKQFLDRERQMEEENQEEEEPVTTTTVAPPTAAPTESSVSSPMATRRPVPQDHVYG